MRTDHCDHFRESGPPYAIVLEAAAAVAARTGAAPDPSLTDIRAIAAAAGEAEAAVRTLRAAASAEIARGIPDRDAYLLIRDIGVWATQGAEMVRRRVGIAAPDRGRPAA